MEKTALEEVIENRVTNLLGYNTIPARKDTITNFDFHMTLGGMEIRTYNPQDKTELSLEEMESRIYSSQDRKKLHELCEEVLSLSYDDYMYTRDESIIYGKDGVGRIHKRADLEK